MTKVSIFDQKTPVEAFYFALAEGFGRAIGYGTVFGLILAVMAWTTP